MSMHIEFTSNFVSGKPTSLNALSKKGKPEVVLTWVPDEFKKEKVHRLVYSSAEGHYVREVLDKDAMGETAWVFEAAWYADNHNNSFDGYMLCEIIRFLVELKGKGG